MRSQFKFSRLGTIAAATLMVLGTACSSPASKETTDEETMPAEVRKPDFWAKLPEQSGFINDYEDILSPDQKTELQGLLTGFEKRTGIEIILLTIDTANVQKIYFD